MLGQILTAILGGGATGLLGTALTTYLDHLNKKLELEHQERMAQVELARFEKEAELRLAQSQVEKEKSVAVAKIEAEQTEAEAHTQAQVASYEHDKASYGVRWLDIFRGLVRPVLTLYLSLVCTIMYVRLEQQLAGEQMVTPELSMAVVQTILYVWTTAALWWFGSRPKSKR